QSFGVSYLPVGMVNRRPYNGSQLVDYNAWGSATEAIIDQPAVMHLDVNALQYQPGSPQVGVMVKMTLTEDLTDDHRLVIYLTEDPVIDWQYDNQATPSDVEFYPHRHVLRGTVTDAWGDVVVNGTAGAGQLIVRQYTYALPANVLEPANCAVVAYVYNTATDEVVQVAERKFVP
ncbi:MAG: Omp28-related outer membrane protein, partial [Flavobacteriales bacterium]|nr:Omp28-related outer membrane protein [Flavobacteriales bacterium]